MSVYWPLIDLASKMWFRRPSGIWDGVINEVAHTDSCHGLAQFINLPILFKGGALCCFGCSTILSGSAAYSHTFIFLISPAAFQSRIQVESWRPFGAFTTRCFGFPYWYFGKGNVHFYCKPSRRTWIWMMNLYWHNPWMSHSFCVLPSRFFSPWSLSFSQGSVQRADESQWSQLPSTLSLNDMSYRPFEPITTSSIAASPKNSQWVCKLLDVLKSTFPRWWQSTTDFCYIYFYLPACEIQHAI